jgi:hypothetical protein
LHDAVEALDDAEQRELRPYFHAGPVDLPVFLAFRLVEQALHAWDVHVAFEPAAAVDAGAVRLLAELLPFGASLADAEVLDTLAPARLTVVTSDPARQFMLDLGAQARLCPAEDGQVSGSLRLPAEALIRLVTGRLDPAHTPAGTVAEGRPSLDELRRLYPGGLTRPRRHGRPDRGRNLSAERTPAPDPPFQQPEPSASRNRLPHFVPVSGLTEPHPSDTQLAQSQWWRENFPRPLFLLITARKTG